MYFIIIVAYVMVVDMVVVTPFLFYLYVQRSRMDASEGFCRSQCIGISSGDGSWSDDTTYSCIDGYNWNSEGQDKGRSLVHRPLP